MATNPPRRRPRTLDEILAGIRSGYETEPYSPELPEYLRAPRPEPPGPPPPPPGPGLLEHALAQARSTFTGRLDPLDAPPLPSGREAPPDLARITQETEDQILKGAAHVAQSGGDPEAFTYRTHQLKYGKRIADVLKASRDLAARRLAEGSPPEEAESQGAELARRHIVNLKNRIDAGEEGLAADESSQAWEGLVHTFTTRAGLASQALTTGAPILAGGIAAAAGAGTLPVAATVIGATTLGEAARQKFIEGRPDVNWEDAFAAGVTNIIPVPLIKSATGGAISKISSPLLRRLVGTAGIAAAEAVEEPVQAVVQALVQGQPIPSAIQLGGEAAAGGILGAALGGSAGLVEQRRQELSDETAGATEIEAAPPTRPIGQHAQRAADEQLASIERALAGARVAGDLNAIAQLEAARQEILDARASGSNAPVSPGPPAPGAAGGGRLTTPVPAPPGIGMTAPGPSPRPAEWEPGYTPPPGPVSGTSIRPQVPTETAAGEAGETTAGEAAGQRQAGTAPQVRSLTEQGKAEGQGETAPPTPPVVRGPTSGTARGVETTPAIPPARPTAPPGATAGRPAAPGPSAPAGAPPVAPTAPPAPVPARRLKIGRGAHGQVEVIFPDQNHADLFSAIGRSRRQMSGQPGIDPNWKGLSSRLGIPEDLIGMAATRYREAVMAALRDLPAGEQFTAPSLAEVASAPPPAAVTPPPAAGAAVVAGAQFKPGDTVIAGPAGLSTVIETLPPKYPGGPRLVRVRSKNVQSGGKPLEHTLAEGFLETPAPAAPAAPDMTQRLVQTPDGWALDLQGTPDGEEAARLFGSAVVPLPLTNEATREQAVDFVRRLEMKEPGPATPAPPTKGTLTDEVRAFMRERPELGWNDMATALQQRFRAPFSQAKKWLEEAFAEGPVYEYVPPEERVPKPEKPAKKPGEVVPFTPKKQEPGALPGTETAEGQKKREQAEARAARREKRATTLSPEEAAVTAAAPGAVVWPSADSVEFAKEWYAAGKQGANLALYRAVAAAKQLGTELHPGWLEVFPDVAHIPTTGRRSTLPVGQYFKPEPAPPTFIPPKRPAIEEMSEPFRKAIDTALERVPEAQREEVRKHVTEQLWRRDLVGYAKEDVDWFKNKFDPTAPSVKIKNRSAKRAAANRKLQSAKALYEGGWETISSLAGPEAKAITARLRNVVEGKGVRTQAGKPAAPPLTRAAYEQLVAITEGAYDATLGTRREGHVNAEPMEVALAKVQEYAKAYTISKEDVYRKFQKLAGELQNLSAAALKGFVDIPGMGHARVKEALTRGMYVSSGRANEDFNAILKYRLQAEAEEAAVAEYFAELDDTEFNHPVLHSVADALDEDAAAGRNVEGEHPLLKTFMWGVADPATGKQVDTEVAIEAIRQGHGRLFHRIRRAYVEAFQAAEDGIPFDVPPGGAAADEGPLEQRIAGISTLFNTKDSDPFGGRYGPPPKNLTPEQIQARLEWVKRLLARGGTSEAPAQRPAGPAVEPEGAPAPGAVGAEPGGEGAAVGEGAARGGSRGGRGLGVPPRVPRDVGEPGEAEAEARGEAGQRASREGIFQIVNPREAETFKNPPKYELIPEDLVPHLSDDQKVGVAKAIEAMQAGSGFLFQDGTGVGKTRELLALAETFRRAGNKVLIVSKASAIEATKGRDGKWHASGSYADDSAAMGIEILFTRERGKPLAPGVIHLGTYHNLRDYAVDKDTVLLFDESHQLKNVGDSEVAASGVELMRRAKVTGFASATPGDKAYHLGYLASIGILEGKPYEQAMKDLGLVATPKKRISKKRYQELRSQGMSEKDAIEAATEEFMVWHATSPTKHKRAVEALFARLTERGTVIKREVDLSPIVVETVAVPLPPEGNKVMQIIEGGKFDKKLMLMHMRRQQEPFKLDAVKARIIRELGEGRQVVVFATRLHKSDVVERTRGMDGELIERILASSEGTLKELGDWLEAEGISHSEIHGEAKESSKDAQARFQSGNVKVVVATYEKGGTGINLDDRSGAAPRTMILMTAPFDAVSIVQAIGRVHRFTTKSASKIVMMYSDHSIDRWNASVIGGKLKQHHAQVSGDINALDLANTVADEEELMAGGAHYMDVARLLNGHGPAGPQGTTIWNARHYGKIIRQLKELGVKINLRGGDFEIRTHEGFGITGSITKGGTGHSSFRWEHDPEAGELRLAEAVKPQNQAPPKAAPPLSLVSSELRELSGQYVNGVKPIVSEKQYQFIRGRLERLGASWGVTELPGSFQILTREGAIFTGELTPIRPGARLVFGKAPDRRDQGGFHFQRLAGEARLEQPIRADIGPPARASERLAAVEKAIDRAYKRGRTEAAENLEAEAEELRTYLEGVEAELEVESEGFDVEGAMGQEGTSIEEQLINKYAELERARAGLSVVGGYSEEDLVAQMRAIVESGGEGTGFPRLGLGTTATDEQIEDAAEELYRERVALRERINRGRDPKLTAALDRWAQENGESLDPAGEKQGAPVSLLEAPTGYQTLVQGQAVSAEPQLPWVNPVRIGTGSLLRDEPGVVATVLREGFATVGKIDWRGIVVRTLADAAAIFHAARNPSIEHAVLFFVDTKTRKVLHSMQATSNSPNFVAWQGTPSYLAEVQSILDAYRGLGHEVIVYNLHNHPSGDPTPSVQDERAFAAMKATLGSRYGGAAVIDHERAVIVTPAGSKIAIGKRARGYMDPDPFFDSRIDTQEWYEGKRYRLEAISDWKLWAQAMLNDGLWRPGSTDVALLVVDAGMALRTMAVVSNATFTDPKAWADYSHRLLTVSGGAAIIGAIGKSSVSQMDSISAALNYISLGGKEGSGTLQDMIHIGDPGPVPTSYNRTLRSASVPTSDSYTDRPFPLGGLRLEQTLRALDPAPSAYPEWGKSAPEWWARRVGYARARTLARGAGAQANMGVDPAAFWDGFVLGVDAIRRGVIRFASWVAELGKSIPGFGRWARSLWDYIGSLGAPIVIERRGKVQPIEKAITAAPLSSQKGKELPIAGRTTVISPIRTVPQATVQDLVDLTNALLAGEAGAPVDVGAGKPTAIGRDDDLAVNINQVEDEGNIRETMARIVRAIEKKFDLARRKYTAQELHTLALALGYDEVDYQRMLKVKGALTAPEIIAGRILRQHAGVDFHQKWGAWREAAERAKERNLEPEELRKRKLEALEAEREKQAALQKFVGMMFATSAAGSEAGRALYAHKLLISTLTPEEQFFQKLMRSGRADQQQIAALADALAKGDQAATARLIRKIYKPGFVRMLTEYFINSLLSGPSTFVANVTGNVVHEALLRTPERALAARLEQLGLRQLTEKLLTGKAEGRERVVGEAMAAVRAQVRHKFGLLAAFKMAAQAITREDIQFLSSVKGESYVPSIPGLFGKIVRTPGRVMEALDIGAKIAAMAAEKAALLWRKAYMEHAGKVGSEAFGERLVELHQLMDEWIALESERQADPKEFRDTRGTAGYVFLYTHREFADLYRQMKHAADVSTFRDETTRFTNFVKQARGAYPWLTFIVPFIHTTERLLVQGLRRTPLGLAKTFYNIQQGKLSGGEASDRLAQGIAGSMMTAAIYMLAADGDLTGGGPEEPKERENWLKTGKLPYAIRIGNTWVSYARIEPFATIFGFAADLAEAKDEKTAGDAFGKLHYAVLNNITNKTYLEGIVSAAEAIGNPDRYMSRFWKRSAGALVPNLLASAARAIDPTIRETDELSQVLTARVPILSATLPARLTGTGEPAKRGETAISRFASPVRYSEEAGPEKNLERLFLETGYSPSQPPRSITIPGTHGRRVDLTRQEREIYGAYARRATEFARSLAKNADWSRLDVYGKEEILKRIYRFAHDAARREMLRSVAARMRRGEVTETPR